jgi:beta-galactosidase GanA
MKISAIARRARLNVLLLSSLLVPATLAAQSPAAQEMPRVVHQDGRYALMVDGKPYLMLGAQVSNSSGWPEKLQALWPMAAAMHVNTLEVPVYWEQMEPSEGKFDDSVVDNVVEQARAHHVRLILLWFATWKNGKMHYAPEWVKSDTKRFPRMITPTGLPIDVLSPNSPANYNADAAAFAHLMAHLRQIDGTQHTVIMMQLENEPGALGAVRDFSPMAQKQFEANVPAEIAQALHKPAGNWKTLFGDDADEALAAYATANYIDKVAEAGKKEFALPMYVNNWLKSPRAYPVSSIPGVDYPSGGPTYNMLDIWKAAGPHIDVIAPDIHVPGVQGFKNVMQQYTRPDNALFIPETDGYGATRGNDGQGRLEFLAIGAGSFGFSPFGIDRVTFGPDGKLDVERQGLAENNRLLVPSGDVIAKLQYEGKMKTAVEEPGLAQIELTFGDWTALVSFPPAFDSAVPNDGGSPSARLKMGRVLIAPIATDEFLVIGIDAQVSFHRTVHPQTVQTQFLRVQEGHYEGSEWKGGRLWNGDEADSGLFFSSPGAVLHVKLGTY